MQGRGWSGLLWCLSSSSSLTASFTDDMARRAHMAQTTLRSWPLCAHAKSSVSEHRHVTNQKFYTEWHVARAKCPHYQDK
mmetsp:Transcript_86164/g.165848  ORF Transcript_86164/g.165848 Transcript_86164/m.165848 type:complete len:80 (-) Transcript_86164:773-1012(-)